MPTLTLVLYPPHDLRMRQRPVHGCAQVCHKVQHCRHEVQWQRVLDVQQPAVKAVVQRQADQLVCSLRWAARGQERGRVNARERRGLVKAFVGAYATGKVAMA